MGKKCPECGRFMKLEDYIGDNDEFDEELAFECGMAEEELNNAIFDFEGKWARFHFVYDQWECVSCEILIDHTEGKRYYWNVKSGNYNGSKPLTPKEKIQRDLQRQEKAGQMRLPIDN